MVEELIAELERIKLEYEREHDGEQAHISADDALLRFIGDARVIALHAWLAVYYS